jgi:hypothetical protein
MRPDAAPATPAADEVPKEPFLRWAGINVLRLTIYLAAASVGTAAVLVSGFESDRWEEVVATAGYTFLAGGLLGIPGTIVWLLLVSRLPPEWSARVRRLFAFIASPSIQVVLLGLLLSEKAYAWAVIFGILLPAGSAFVVRLRGRSPSSLGRRRIDLRRISCSGAGPGTSGTRNGDRRGSGSRHPS